MRITLACGTFKLLYNKSEESLWVGPDQKSTDDVEIAGPIELFGFGSGDFCSGSVPELQFRGRVGGWFFFWGR